MVDTEGKTPEEIIAQMKKEMEDKYKKERKALAEKKKDERNALRRKERELKKAEKDNLGKVIYDNYGIKSVVELENEYEIVKRTLLEPTVQVKSTAEKTKLFSERKMELIESFYKETGEWCLNKQRENTLSDTSVSNRVANFFREFYDIQD